MSTPSKTRMRKMRLLALAGVAPCCVLLAVACGGSDYADPDLDDPDAATADGATADRTVPPGMVDGSGGRDVVTNPPRDGSLGETGVVNDASITDTGTTDAAIVDAGVADADAAVQDAGAPDADAAIVDAGVPDADAAIQDAAIQDSAVQDSAIPDAALPDANAPDAQAGGIPDLRTAKAFAILAGQSVSNSGPTTIGGNIGISPGSSLTGLPAGQPPFPFTTHVGNDGVAVQAQLDLTTVYNDLAGRPCPASNVLTGQNLAGLTLSPGVYCFSSSAALGVGALTLNANGDPNAFWVFQIASTLDVAASTVNVINGGSVCNVFWQVGSSATVLDNAAFAGNIIAFSSITLNTGAVVTGRALARNASVSMLSNAVSKVSCP